MSDVRLCVHESGAGIYPDKNIISSQCDDGDVYLRNGRRVSQSMEVKKHN